MTTALSAENIETAIGKLEGWAYAEGKLTKTYKFGSFREAMGFIVRVGFEAEAMNHHPELFNVYSTVKVSLSTHDAGDAVTQKDVDLAEAIERVSWV
ncbi:MAG: 4a-hydroxytetrahydrobiopterin dehydratase [Phycisphaeraceae bacterium]